jgi:hypothetical protein
MKLCPQSLCDLAGISPFVEEKFDDYALFILHENSKCNLFERIVEHKLSSLRATREKAD